MTAELLERNFLVGEQFVPCRNGNYQRVPPDWLGDDAVANIGGMSKADHEVTEAQTAQLFGQGDFGQAYLDLRRFRTAIGQERRQAGIDRTIGHRYTQATSRTRCDSLHVLSRLFEHGK